MEMLKLLLWAESVCEFELLRPGTLCTSFLLIRKKIGKLVVFSLTWYLTIFSVAITEYYRLSNLYRRRFIQLMALEAQGQGLCLLKAFLLVGTL